MRIGWLGGGGGGCSASLIMINDKLSQEPKADGT